MTSGKHLLLGRTILWFFLLIVMIPGALFADTGRRIALVVGNGDYGYEEDNLPNAVRDAKDIYNVLHDLGFEMEKLALNRNELQMIKAIEAFQDRAKGAEMALFYYAGHGAQSRQIGYLLPVGPQYTDETEVRTYGVEVDTLVKIMAQTGSQTSLLILDACRNLSVARSWTNVRGGHKKGLPGNFPNHSNILIFYSTQPNNIAHDGKIAAGNSPFASELKQALTEKGLELSEMMTKVSKGVQDYVKKEFDEKQIPFRTGTKTREFYFIPPTLDSELARIKKNFGTEQLRETLLAFGSSFESAPQSSSFNSDFIESSTGMEFVRLPGGCFQMGQTAKETEQLIAEEGKENYKKYYDYELPRHEVCVDEFY